MCVCFFFCCIIFYTNTNTVLNICTADTDTKVYHIDAVRVCAHVCCYDWHLTIAILISAKHNTHTYIRITCLCIHIDVYHKHSNIYVPTTNTKTLTVTHTHSNSSNRLAFTSTVYYTSCMSAFVYIQLHDCFYWEEFTISQLKTVHMIQFSVDQATKKTYFSFISLTIAHAQLNKIKTLELHFS